MCIKGFRTDGHYYINDALQRGAVGVVVERDVPIPHGIAWARLENTRHALAVLAANFYGHPSRELALFGVTGTNGKTTTTHLIEAVLRAKGQKTGLIGTVWNKIGDEKVAGNRTTPESLDLQCLLRKMVSAGVKSAVMEVSSHGLALHRVALCEFDVAVFTNLTQDHLDFHASFEEYFASKLLLFTGLDQNRTKKRSCYAVVNADDPAGREIIRKVNVPVLTYGLRKGADVVAQDIQMSPTGTTFNLGFAGEKFPFAIALPGEFNVYNALAAIAVGIQEGLSLPALQKALAQVKRVPGRFEVIDLGQNFTVVVDYAHTPDGLKKVLETARALTKGKLIVVFGCGGDRDQEKRPIMGRIAGSICDFTFITSDNPRTEDPEKILAQIEAGIKGVTSAYSVVEDRYQAIRSALHCAQKGDFVVIAGKGHENYQILKDRTIPFDDRQVVREVLTKEILSNK
ncbi:MAG: UDP-N-acetylmuramoyl-L-alanyl-D-glutamate--2,6-diaminopimelate ligase [Thermoanaerobacterales bacterium 50_218]|nr:MAG: UDP-N-acetylmuramoyl-L-alanyl-D-glutamate--2,6-diaminopimelate ligase [Thermoanaerobacterales bacterium 50_218]